MKTARTGIYLCALWLCLIPNVLPAQGPVAAPSDTTRRIQVLKADYTRLTKNGGGEQFLRGDVVFYHDSTFLYCDSALLRDNRVTAMGEVVVLRSDTLKMFGDSLLYDGTERIMTMYGDVLVQTSSRELTTRLLRYDLTTEIMVYAGPSLIADERGDVYSQRGIYRSRSGVFEVADSVVVLSDSLDLYADTLLYLTREERVLFEGPTRIFLEAGEVYCEDGYYDYPSGYASFQRSATMQGDDMSAQADRIDYDARRDSIILTGEAEYTGSDMRASGQEIRYNRTSGDGVILGDGVMDSDGQLMRGDRLVFNTLEESFRSTERTRFASKDFDLDADIMNFQQHSEDPGYAYGDVQYRDTINDLAIDSDTLLFRQQDEYILAYGNRPVLKIAQEPGDTLYICADTLWSRLLEDSSRLLLAYHDVRIYSDDFQGRCDSLSFSDIDSILRFWKAPVLWLDTTQLSADTMSLRLQDGEPDYLYMKRNALLVSLAADPYYQQIRGREIYGAFAQKSLSQVHVIGNAESIYYLQNDDQDYIGVNRSMSAEITMDFVDNQLDRIHWIKQNDLTFSPMEMYQHTSARLDGFHWSYDQRPATVLALRYDLPQ